MPKPVARRHPILRHPDGLGCSGTAAAGCWPSWAVGDQQAPPSRQHQDERRRHHPAIQGDQTSRDRVEIPDPHDITVLATSRLENNLRVNWARLPARRWTCLGCTRRAARSSTAGGPRRARPDRRFDEVVRPRIDAGKARRRRVVRLVVGNAANRLPRVVNVVGEVDAGHGRDVVLVVGQRRFVDGPLQQRPQRQGLVAVP